MLLTTAALLVLVCTTAATLKASPQQKKQPNIVFLVCESTDGRTWRKGYQDDVIPLPNIRALEQQPGGYAFHRHYSNTPVCCPSRATFWSGRHAHKIPHVQTISHFNETTQKHTSKQMAVDGVWNNFEGLPHDFDERIDQVLDRQGYSTHLSGKLDFTTGGHSDNVKVSAWTMYTRFPYDIPKSGGWRDEDEDMCNGNGTVFADRKTAHFGDWKTLNETVQWLKDNHAQNNDKPFFVYQGMNIVHPPYTTTQQWYDKIDPTKITVPEWAPLEDMHPCDFQSSMMKGCIPALDNATARDNAYSKDRRRNIRRIYYAMIAEFDAMVGAYMDAVKEIGEWDNTIFVVTSDHGDLQMEHQQSYKMVPYDASSSVPMVISDNRVQAKKKSGRNHNKNAEEDRVVRVPTQLIDLYPTIMDLAGVSPKDYPVDRLDGNSLVPLMTKTKNNGSVTTAERPDFVVSQFHGMNIAMSWFLIVKDMPCVDVGGNDDNKVCTYKLVVWGTGHEVDSQLFDLTHDPDEMVNAIGKNKYQQVVANLQNDLRSVVDYPRVAMNVARYNRDSMKNWMEVLGDPQWREAIHTNLRWDATWDLNSEGAFQALEEWVNSSRVEVMACRSDMVWPPKGGMEKMEAQVGAKAVS